jgi:hypothetical protein
MKQCSACHQTKKNKEFYKGSNRCKVCAKNYQNEYNLRKRGETSSYEPEKLVVTEDGPIDSRPNPHKSMWHGAKSRAKAKGLPFNITSQDIIIPTLCPVLKIPLIQGEGTITDASPTLDKRVPHLGYVVGNVTVISSLANRIKTNANSMQIAAVLDYVLSIEQENT